MESLLICKRERERDEKIFFLLKPNESILTCGSHCSKESNKIQRSEKNVLNLSIALPLSYAG